MQPSNRKLQCTPTVVVLGLELQNSRKEESLRYAQPLHSIFGWPSLGWIWLSQSHYTLNSRAPTGSCHANLHTYHKINPLKSKKQLIVLIIVRWRIHSLERETFCINCWLFLIRINYATKNEKDSLYIELGGANPFWVHVISSNNIYDWACSESRPRRKT